VASRYELEFPAFDIAFVADRIRRERHELHGELSVRCGMPGARTVDGMLSVGELNFSSVRARQDRARLLAQRAQTKDEVDWFGLLEQFSHGVFAEERTGDPAVDLRALQRPERGDELVIDGLSFPRRHPSILFGDGGAAKSYIALYVAGEIERRGLNVLFADWELSGEDHRDRLERLFGEAMPRILYARCERPLTAEADRLRRIVAESRIDFMIYDSVAFACDGPPEAAEVAGRYFRAVREIGCGSLHVAHVNRSEHHDRKPFGSTFWHNGARSTWFVDAVDRAGDEASLQIGAFNRKSNLGGLRPPAGFNVRFDEERTSFERADVSDNPDLAGRLTVWQRMRHALRHGAMTPDEIAEEIEADPETIRREARRRKRDFVVLDGGRIGVSIGADKGRTKGGQSAAGGA
jgi:hypothetical protein